MKKVKITLLAALLMLSILFVSNPKHAHANVRSPETIESFRCQDNPAHESWGDWFWNCNYSWPAED